MDHEGHISLGDEDHAGAPDGTGALKAHFVRYPGCQQLILWLPRSGRSGYGRLQVLTADGTRLVDDPVSDRLNGEVQILLDTLGWPPGEMRLSVTHEDGWCHALGLSKSHDGTPVVLPQPSPLADPGEDLALRARVIGSLPFRELLQALEVGPEAHAPGAPRDAAPPAAARRATMTERTVRLHRVLRSPPDKVYRAFLDAEAMAKWLPPYGFTCRVHELDARVGGRFRMSFTHFASGHSHAFGGEYLELVPNQRLRYTDRFDDPGLPGELVVTVSLQTLSCGTGLDITQQGIPEVIPLEMCHLGWQESLAQLALLVEPVLPG